MVYTTFIGIPIVAPRDDSSTKPLDVPSGFLTDEWLMPQAVCRPPLPWMYSTAMRHMVCPMLCLPTCQTSSPLMRQAMCPPLCLLTRQAAPPLMRQAMCHLPRPRTYPSASPLMHPAMLHLSSLWKCPFSFQLMHQAMRPPPCPNTSKRTPH